MVLFYLKHPTATLSRGIENLVIYGHHCNVACKIACELTARAVSVVVFPLFLSMELLLIRCPKLVMSIGQEKFWQKADKACGYLLAFVPSMILGFYSPEFVPGFFLKRAKATHEVRPFGVENRFGIRVDREISYPKSVQEVQDLVKQAKGKQISVIGAGMSQGTQTTPQGKAGVVLHTKYLNHIQPNLGENTVTVGAGATWEEVLLALDPLNKSVIVKQASDIFSIGGSIAINCHGWAHEYGSISKTVKSMQVVDANGDLRVLKRPREDVSFEELTDDEKLFKCMFGTLGYFGVIVGATLDIVDNEMLTQKMIEINPEEFFCVYTQQIQGHNRPLFGGRLALDMVGKAPLGTICMDSYQKVEGKSSLVGRKIVKEPKWGTRIERIFLKLISHLPQFFVERMTHFLWKQKKREISSSRTLTRNEALHPPINLFRMFHHSDLYAQWLQEYFIKPENLPAFLKFLGEKLKTNDVKLINATIRSTPKDEISILPYAEQDRYAVVLCFSQKKTEDEIAKTKRWIEEVNAYLVKTQGVFYQAYMPYATAEQFEACYGKEQINQMRQLKRDFDPQNLFGNAHTAKYYDTLRT
jgi:decaprenylphospho-beta-D-ribofuranose 2-oxidase